MNAAIRFGFDKAIVFIKLGRKVTREGWDGRWLQMEQQTTGDDSGISLSYIFIYYQPDTKNTPGVRVTWLVNQADLLAEDWMLVED